jgi:predicted dehydrogenase
VAVSDGAGAAAAGLAGAYGADTRTTEDILPTPRSTAVLIANSTGTHADLIEAAP